MKKILLSLLVGCSLSVFGQGIVNPTISANSSGGSSGGTGGLSNNVYTTGSTATVDAHVVSLIGTNSGNFIVLTNYATMPGNSMFTNTFGVPALVMNAAVNFATTNISASWGCTYGVVGGVSNTVGFAVGNSLYYPLPGCSIPTFYVPTNGVFYFVASVGGTAITNISGVQLVAVNGSGGGGSTFVLTTNELAALAQPLPVSIGGSAATAGVAFQLITPILVTNRYIIGSGWGTVALNADTNFNSLFVSNGAVGAHPIYVKFDRTAAITNSHAGTAGRYFLSNSISGNQFASTVGAGDPTLVVTWAVNGGTGPAGTFSNFFIVTTNGWTTNALVPWPEKFFATFYTPVGAWDGGGLISVSPIGIANGTSIFVNGGAAYGPDSTNNTTGLLTTTSGINEFIADHPNDVVHLGEGAYLTSGSIISQNPIIGEGFQSTAIIDNDPTQLPVVSLLGSASQNGIVGVMVSSVVNNERTYILGGGGGGLFVRDCWIAPWNGFTNGMPTPPSFPYPWPGSYPWPTAAAIADNEGIGISSSFYFGPEDIIGNTFNNLACAVDMNCDSPVWRHNNVQYFQGTNSYPVTSQFSSGAAVIFEASAANCNPDISGYNFFGNFHCAYLVMPPTTSLTTNNFICEGDEYEIYHSGSVVLLNTNQFWRFKNPHFFQATGDDPSPMVWGSVYNPTNFTSTLYTITPGGNSSQIVVVDERAQYTSCGWTYGGTITSTNGGFVGTFTATATNSGAGVTVGVTAPIGFIVITNSAGQPMRIPGY